MVKVSGSTITITHGDTLLKKVSIKGDSGDDYILSGNDRLRFALKESYLDAEPLLVKPIPIDTMVLRLESSETKQLKQHAKYVYDIEVTIDDGTEEGFVRTVISGTLITVEDVD